MSVTTFHDIRYADVGERNRHEAIILLHGFSEQLELWDDYTKQLSKHYRVIAPDLRGHTPKQKVEATAWTLSDMAWDVKTLLDHCVIYKAVVVGHSLGGYVALKMAKLFPERIKGLSLFHSHPFADTPTVRENRNRTIELLSTGQQESVVDSLLERVLPENFRTSQPAKTAALRTMMMKSPAEGLMGAVAAMRDRHDMTDILRKAEFPVQCILGGADPIVSVEQMFAFAPHIRSVSIEYLREVGHQGMIESPAVCLKVLQGFFTRCLA